MITRNFRKILFLLALVCNYIVVVAQDLVITQVTPSDTTRQYKLGYVNFTIKNQGIVDIPYSGLVNFYLSTDEVLDLETDKLLASVTVDTLTAGQSKTIASGLFPIQSLDQYYLIAVADAENQVKETNEFNNSFIATYQVHKADVELRFVNPPEIRNFVTNLPGPFPWDESFYANYTIENIGSTSLTGIPLRTSFYLSSDQVLDANDSLLCTSRATFQSSFSPITNIIIKGSDYPYAMITIPKVAPGTYYIIAVIDDNGQGMSYFNETDKTDNTNVIGPLNIVQGDTDLTVGSVVATAIEVDYNISNKGSVKSCISEYKINFYSSLDSIFDKTDTLIFTASINDPTYEFITNNYPLERTAHFAYGDVSAGDHYWIVEINPDRKIYETDTTNNVSISNRVTFPKLPPIPPMVLDTVGFGNPYKGISQFIEPTLVFYKADSATFVSTHQKIRVTITDLSQTVVFEQDFDLYIDFSGHFFYTVLQIQLPAPLAAGNYTMQFDCVSASCPITNSYSLALDITKQKIVKIAGTVRAEDSTPITHGWLYFYHLRKDTQIELLDRKILTSSNEFDFITAYDSITFYFIPDSIDFPGFVPTVFGNSVNVRSGSWISPQQDTTVVFQILKSKGVSGSGNSIISGSISEAGGTAGRVTNLLSIKSIPVLLLNDQGDVIAYTHTNAEGNFVFKGLPPGNYKIYLAFEPYTNIKTNLTNVDTSTGNVTVNFSVSSDGGVKTQENVVTGVEQTMAAIMAYPNPFTSRIYIDSEQDYVTTILVNTLGESLSLPPIRKGRNELDLSYLSPGVHLLRVSGARTIILKLIKTASK